MKALIFHEVKKGILASILTKPLEMIKDIQTVSVSVSYTTRSQPDVARGKEFTFDVDKTKESLQRFFKRGERDMAAYQFEVIWLNEMGDEQTALVETTEERDSKIQSLANDGYSPVWREIH